MEELRANWLCFARHGTLPEIGRMLTWLGENCETFCFVLTMPQSVTRADDALDIRVAFRDNFEAAAFSTRFSGCEDQTAAQ